MQALAHNLAHNLESIRSMRQMSQARLAELAGIPRSTLTHIESGAGNPSLSNLAKLAGALQVSIEELLTRPRSSVLLLKAGQVPIQQKGDGRIEIFKLLPEKIKGLEIDRMEFAPGTAFRGTPHILGTKEYLHGLQGSVTVLVAGEIYMVNPGDVLAFPGDQPHSYRNGSAEQAVAISIVVPVPLTH